MSGGFSAENKAAAFEGVSVPCSRRRKQGWGIPTTHSAHPIRPRAELRSEHPTAGTRVVTECRGGFADASRQRLGKATSLVSGARERRERSRQRILERTAGSRGRRFRLDSCAKDGDPPAIVSSGLRDPMFRAPLHWTPRASRSRPDRRDPRYDENASGSRVALDRDDGSQFLGHGMRFPATRRSQ
jgi:hypothetical protein